LDSRPYFQQLVCRTGFKLNPSRKKGSAGAAFLMTISKTELDQPLRDDFKVEPEDLFDYVYEWFQDNRMELKEKGITDLSLSAQDPKLVLVVEDVTCKLTQEQIFELMKTDLRLEKEITSDFKLSRITTRPALNTPVCGFVKV
jgi:hypothetical protein